MRRALGEKAFFKKPLAERRGPIPATGFREWSEKSGKRRPSHFARPDGKPFGFAGLGRRTDTEGRAAVQVAILTTDASTIMKPSHHRRPVILPPDNWEAWLGCKRTSPPEAVKLPRPAPDDFLVAVAASDKVNSAKNDDAKLIESAEPPTRAPTK